MRWRRRGRKLVGEGGIPFTCIISCMVAIIPYAADVVAEVLAYNTTVQRATLQALQNIRICRERSKLESGISREGNASSKFAQVKEYTRENCSAQDCATGTTFLKEVGLVSTSTRHCPRHSQGTREAHCLGKHSVSQ